MILAKMDGQKFITGFIEISSEFGELKFDNLAFVYIDRFSSIDSLAYSIH